MQAYGQLLVSNPWPYISLYSHLSMLLADWTTFYEFLKDSEALDPALLAVSSCISVLPWQLSFYLRNCLLQKLLTQLFLLINAGD